MKSLPISFCKLVFAVITRKLNICAFSVILTRNLIFWTREMKFWQPRWVCFSWKQISYTQSPKKKKNRSSKNQFSSKCFCVREKKLQVCQKNYGNNFRGKYAENESLWIFHFFPQNDVVHMQKAVLTTAPGFFHHKSRNLSLKVHERWKTSEKWKKTVFFKKIVADIVEWVWTAALKLFLYRA